MGLFRKIGRQVEQFKREATAAADRETEYECTACGTRFDADRDRCSECGSEDIVPASERDE